MISAIELGSGMGPDVVQPSYGSNRHLQMG